MGVERVASWAELNEGLYAHTYRPELGRFRSSYAFRGVCDASYSLDTSLSRLGRHYAGMERHIVRNFRKYAYRTMAERDSLWYWLSVGQHHGLPTRLLDWTFSPEVAAHFATADDTKRKCDGAIWCVDFRAAHRLAPASLRKALACEGSDIFTVEMLAHALPDFAALEELRRKAFLLFFEPPSLDDRIVNQFALHSVLSHAQARFDKWLTAHPKLWRKIIVPAKLKGEIRDKLDQANITERVLFPGLDGLTAWLKRQYSAR